MPTGGVAIRRIRQSLVFFSIRGPDIAPLGLASIAGLAYDPPRAIPARVKNRLVKEDKPVNSLKPLAIIAVLGGIGYAVYSRIHGDNESPPPGAVSGWQAPTVQLPGDSSPPGSPW